MPRPIQSERFLTSPGLTPEAWTRTRTSPAPGRGASITPTVSTSLARPPRSYQAARIRKPPRSPVTVHSIAKPRASTNVYSPNVGEGVFCELRFDGVLRRSLVANPTENRPRSGTRRSVEPPQLVGPSQIVQNPQVVRYQQHRREPFVP